MSQELGELIDAENALFNGALTKSGAGFSS